MSTQAATTELPEHVKRDAIALLQQFIDDEISFDAVIRQARKLSRVSWYRRMLADLQIDFDPDLPRLPNAPSDGWQLQHRQMAHDVTQRVIHFLQAGRSYDDAELAWVCWLNRIVVVGFVVSILAGGGVLLAQKWLGLGDTLQPVVQGFGVTALICFVPVAATHIIELAIAGIHIFRVRVLRRDLRDQLDQDIWPYLNREDYEADLAELASPKPSPE